MSSDNYGTPPPIFRALDKEFNFTVDICAEHSTAKCEHYFTKEDDSLNLDWHKGHTDGYIWCNPPYSCILPWVMKAQEAQRNGVGTVMLIMGDPSVQWFKQALKTVSEVRFILGRLSFYNSKGNPVHGNNKGSCIFVFDPHRIGTMHTTYVERNDLIDKGLGHAKKTN